jgi:hypothetical protein
MDLNHIHLPPAVITDLYRTSLIEANETPVIVKSDRLQTTAPVPGKHLGENQKNILIVVDYTDAVYLPDEELSFLTGMLTACKLSLADVAIVNRNNCKEISYKELMANFKSKIVFLFGVDPVSFGLPVNFPHFQVQSFANATFLFSPALEEPKNDKLLKSKLWVCLRHIFGI